MSLDPAERDRTREELAANLDLTGLSADTVAADLGFTRDRLGHALGLTSDPVDVWLLRDYLHQAVLDSGHTPVPFTVLTNSSRLKARLWFRLRKAPRHDFSLR
ncbi:DUF2316 family protein [Streptomyces sp. NPDC091406]|uniref:DUF2316 family protein n=1 Tax=unclassified Streptomyces TaxID=2593676 RepID=UPI0037F33CCD